MIQGSCYMAHSTGYCATGHMLQDSARTTGYYATGHMLQVTATEHMPHGTCYRAYATGQGIIMLQGATLQGACYRTGHMV